LQPKTASQEKTVGSGNTCPESGYLEACIAAKDGAFACVVPTDGVDLSKLGAFKEKSAPVHAYLKKYGDCDPPEGVEAHGCYPSPKRWKRSCEGYAAAAREELATEIDRARRAVDGYVDRVAAMDRDSQIKIASESSGIESTVRRIEELLHYGASESLLSAVDLTPARAAKAKAQHLLKDVEKAMLQNQSDVACPSGKHKDRKLERRTKKFLRGVNSDYDVRRIALGSRPNEFTKMSHPGTRFQEVEVRACVKEKKKDGSYGCWVQHLRANRSKTRGSSWSKWEISPGGSNSMLCENLP
jgi:hypothetical protein